MLRPSSLFPRCLLLPTGLLITATVQLHAEEAAPNPAAASIRVVAGCPQVEDPVAVRYACRNAPVAGLFNSEVLPAAHTGTTWPTP